LLKNWAAAAWEWSTKLEDTELGRFVTPKFLPDELSRDPRYAELMRPLGLPE
jgi:hypothetical protein